MKGVVIIGVRWMSRGEDELTPLIKKPTVAAAERFARDHLRPGAFDDVVFWSFDDDGNLIDSWRLGDSHFSEEER